MANNSVGTLDAGFFDSTELVQLENGFYQGNKAKSADFMASFFAGFVTNGVRGEDPFAVTVSGNSVTVGPGKVYINGRMGLNEGTVTGNVADFSVLKTIYIVLQLDIPSQEMVMVGVVNPSSDFPSRKSAGIWQLAVARITIPAGATELTKDMVEDLRDDQEWCGRATAEGSIMALKEYVDGLYRSITAVPDVEKYGLRPIALSTIDPGAGSASGEPDGTMLFIFE